MNSRKEKARDKEVAPGEERPAIVLYASLANETKIGAGRWRKK